MKAINLGFSHGSADAQNRFPQKEKEEKKYITARPAPVNTFITSVSNKTGFVEVQLD